ncbi:alpha/beta hydrolase [Sandaracinus amylolyticus]|uniref:alpha/beta hydrolase n=1 Tax=Sandaracinus amylolyticus TaxID=927083 RepID=UPI001EED34C1|nr:alpha/beta hydrolase-fold protein [Sandaracinus amylolyticus]UJR80366.1 Enterobactin/ferric enterobactin esterase [Sandaracinus amylolyticus]
MTRAACAVIAIVALTIAMVPPGASSQAQSRSEAVHHRHLRVDAPWGSERVLVMFPRLGGGREIPRDHRWSVLVALHGQGEARRGPERGYLGWSVDYRLPDAFAALLRGRLLPRDFGGMVRLDHLAIVNAQLARDRFEGLMVVCPYTPDLMPETPGSERIRAWGDWVAGPMLEQVRAQLPGAAHGRASTGIDGVSLGGMLALEVGLRHPETFSTVGAMQPAIRNREDAIAAIAPTDGSQRIRLLTSDQDPFRAPTEQLSERLRARQVAHDLAVVPGPHDYSFNRGPGALEMLLFHEHELVDEPL